MKKSLLVALGALLVATPALAQEKIKFKAIGQDAQGQVVPGGGPLTERHNMSFDRLDSTEIVTRLDGKDG